MKRIKLALIISLATFGFVAQAQVDFNSPQLANWGPDAASREANMLKSTFFKDAMTNKSYDEAATYYQELVASCPEASEAVFARGVALYKAKVARAKDLAEKKVMVDSLMIAHDLRLKYWSNHATRGRVFILDAKARDYYNFKRSDRAGLRSAFKEAVEAAGEGADPQLALLYFQNVCEDYKIDEVMADEVMAVYEDLSPFFDKLTGEDTKFRDDFTTSFSVSGAATCENLESIYTAKLAAEPENVELLAKCVRLMARLKCDSPFYIANVEKLYELEPSSQAAMTLASVYQNKGEYDKASQYLRDALAAEEDVEERETLNARIALIELAANRISAAAAAARESINTPDDTKSDNGVAYFVLAQCYATAAAGCSGFDGQAVYWLAYDTMMTAIANFSSEEESYKSVAQQSAAAYQNYFPSQEECFFNEIKSGESYTLKCSIASGISTTVRPRAK